MSTRLEQSMFLPGDIITLILIIGGPLAIVVIVWLGFRKGWIKIDKINRKEDM